MRVLQVVGRESFQSGGQRRLYRPVIIKQVGNRVQDLMLTRDVVGVEHGARLHQFPGERNALGIQDVQVQGLAAAADRQDMSLWLDDLRGQLPIVFQIHKKSRM